MPPGMHPEELEIQHVREPGQRVPVSGMQGGESPGEPLISKAILDRGIFSDVYAIIEIDKLMGSQIAIDGQRGHHQEEAGDYFPAAVWHVASNLKYCFPFSVFGFLSLPGGLCL